MRSLMSMSIVFIIRSYGGKFKFNLYLLKYLPFFAFFKYDDVVQWFTNIRRCSILNCRPILCFLKFSNVRY